jgi:hypothetical protein
MELAGDRKSSRNCRQLRRTSPFHVLLQWPAARKPLNFNLPAFMRFQQFTKDNSRAVQSLVLSSEAGILSPPSG